MDGMRAGRYEASGPTTPLSVATRPEDIAR
jgi:hypothetical protein